MSLSDAAQAHEGPFAQARLQQLGIEEADLLEAVQVSELERQSCSSLEPPSGPAIRAWLAANRTLAELLVPKGWHRVISKGLQRVINPHGTLAIAVVAGDHGTGLAAGHPKSKSPRGPQSLSFVHSNQEQLPFPEGLAFEPDPVDPDVATWWLLIYSDEAGYRAELSFPIGTDAEGRLSDWQERIILQLPDASLSSSSQDDEEPPLEFEVNVRSK